MKHVKDFDSSAKRLALFFALLFSVFGLSTPAAHAQFQGFLEQLSANSGSGGHTYYTQDPAQFKASVSDSRVIYGDFGSQGYINFPVGATSITLSATNYGAFSGSGYAETSSLLQTSSMPPLFGDGSSDTDTTLDLQAVVRYVGNDPRPPASVPIQIVEYINGSGSGAQNTKNTQDTADAQAQFDVSSVVTVYTSSNEPAPSPSRIRERVGSGPRSGPYEDDGPINVTATDGETITIQYGMVSAISVNASGGFSTGPVSFQFAAGFGYHAPPGWELDLVSGNTYIPLPARLPEIPSASLTASPNPATYGQPVTLTANFSPSGTGPTGLVTFMDGTTSVGSAPLVDGRASLTLSDLPVGDDSLTFTYGGDSTYPAGTSSPLTETVNSVTAGTARLILTPAAASQSGGIVTVHAFLTNAGTAPATGATVTRAVLGFGIVGRRSYPGTPALAPLPSGLSIAAGASVPITLTFPSTAIERQSLSITGKADGGLTFSTGQYVFVR